MRGGGLLDLRASGAGSGRFVEAERILTGPPGIDFGLQALRHGEDPRRLDIPFGSARIAGMALSVDAVWWAARPDGMRASMLASAPASRQVDPLPALGRDEGEPNIDGGEPEEQPSAGTNTLRTCSAIAPVRGKNVSKRSHLTPLVGQTRL